MHPCAECGEYCDCDGEDHVQSTPDDCDHVCEGDEHEDFEIFPDDYLVTGDAAHDVQICVGCGCSALNPCPGGCVWTTETRCSRCVG